MSRRRPTIIDVAERAGVSTATVSRVLNGGPVNEVTRRTVERAIEELGYRPNTLARGLVTGRTGVIGVVVPDVLGPLYFEMARGIEETLVPRSMHPVMVTDNRDAAQERYSIELLLEKRVDGLILIGSSLQDGELESLAGGLPVVLLQREVEGEAFCTIEVDNDAGIRQALELLFSLGHREIAHVAGVRRDGFARRASFERYMEAAGLSPHRILESDFSEASGYAAGRCLARDAQVTAVLCTNDRTALGVAKAFGEAGRRVPLDVSLVGFDDHPWSAYLQPPLTTVRQPAREMGRHAAELVASESPPGPDASITVQPILVPRASVGAPPTARVTTGR